MRNLVNQKLSWELFPALAAHSGSSRAALDNSMAHAGRTSMSDVGAGALESVLALSICVCVCSRSSSVCAAAAAPPAAQAAAPAVDGRDYRRRVHYHR